MVAIVSGNSLGLELTSMGVLGNQGLWGLPGQGNSGEQVYVNAATGNLVVQRKDDFLASHGLENRAVRTYNSLGQFTDDNGDNWAMGVYSLQLTLTGIVNTLGSTLTHTGLDGSVRTYTWDASRSAYVTTAGGGAHDTIVFDSVNGQYLRTDGSTRDVERYQSSTGRLMSVTDAAGNSNTYTYTGNLLTKVVDKSGETIWYDYTGTQLTKIRVEYKSGTDTNGNAVWTTRSTVSYGYDTSGRLSTVSVDLTPADGSIADGKVYSTSYTYDGTSKRIKTLSQTDGSSLTFSYVQVGSEYRVATITDALNTVTSYSYDTANRRTTVVVDSAATGLNQTWLFDYDTGGQLIKLTSPAVAGTSITQSFSYDSDGNLVTTVNGDGETTTIVYDANGNQTKVTNALGTSVNRTYDANNQLLTETVSTLSAPSLVNQGGMAIVGTDIIKRAGTDGIWDGSIRSSMGLTGGASVSFKPGQTDKAFMVGLNSDPGYNHGWSSLDYAIYCTGKTNPVTNSGILEVRESESGNKLTDVIEYAVGDELRVTYDGSKVTYLKNGVVFFTSQLVNTSVPLYVDSSFKDVGAKINSLTFGTTASTGQIRLLSESNAKVNSDGSVSKTAGANGKWDASVRSLVGHTGGAMASFTINQLNKSLMIGLSSNAAASDTNLSIDYAVFCTSDGELFAYESGDKIDLSVAPLRYAVGDTFRVIYDGSKVQYQQIRAGVTTVLREVDISIDSALYLDSSFLHTDAKVNNLQFGRATLSTLAAVASAITESGAVVIGDSITKSSGTEGNWDTSVHSETGTSGQANLSFSAGQRDKSIMVGLNTALSSSYSWTKLDYAFYCGSDGILEVREGGDTANKLITAATYTEADRLQITYDGTYVRYLKNGDELLKTAATITDPIYFDCSLASIGAKITNLRFGDRASPELTSRYVYSTTTPGQILYAITAQGRVTQYKYNSFGERTSQITYPDNAYNLAGLANTAVPSVAQMDAWVVGIGDLKGSVRTDYGYDGRGLMSYLRQYVATNPDGSGQLLRITRYIYDQAGRLLQTIEPESTIGTDELGAPTTTYTYDGLGRQLTVLDQRGVFTTTVYSDSTQSVTITNQSGAAQTSTYDRAGRLISVSKSGVGTTAYAYDNAGHLLMVTDPVGTRSFWLYDEAGRQVAAIDGSGTLTETTFDKADRVTRVYTYANPVDLAKLVSGTGVSLNPTLLSIRPTTSSADVCRWNFFDDAGQLTYELAENGALTRHEYDGASRRIRTVRFGQIIATSGATFSTITALLSEAGLTAGAADDRSERLFYDADGLLVGMLDGEGFLTRITFDNAGRKVRTQRYATAVDTAKRAGGGKLESILPTTSINDQTETYFYDARGLLTGTIDSLGYITRNGYNERGQRIDQTRYSTALGRVPDWKEDLSTIILEIRPGGAYAPQDDDRVSIWRYALDGQLLYTTNHEGIKTSYAYDSAGRLVKSTVGDGLADARATQYRLDAWGRQMAVLGGAGSAKLTANMTQAQIDTVWATDAVDYTYDSLGRVSSTTDANGFKTLYFYDVDGRLTHTVNARGAVQETQYNTLGQRTATVSYGSTVSVTSLVGGLMSQVLLDRLAARSDKTQDSKTTYTYDIYGRLYSTTQADGAITYTRYNVFGEVSDKQVAWQAGASLNTSKRLETFAYDHRGMAVSVNRDDGRLNAITSTIYDAFGRVVSTTDPLSKTTEIAYDKLGRVIRITNPLNKSVRTDYDAFGQALRVTNELDKVTTYVYDRAARSVTMTTPEGVSVTTTHNAYGQSYSVNDGNGVIRYFLYDQDGNLTQKKVGSTVVQTDDHDAGGRLVSSTDADGVVTKYSYDDVNHTLTKVVDPSDADAEVELNLTTKWFYDPKGQTIKVIDARSVETTYTFDLEGRTIKQIVDSAGGLALETKWTYDAEGRVATVVDANNVTTQYTYDALGRRITEVVDPGTDHLNLTRRYTYDKNGNVLTATDRNGKITTYGYDDTGRQTSTVDAENNLTFTEYTWSGQVSRVTRYEAPWTDAENPTTRPTASSADQVTRHWYDDDDRLQYTADASGAVTQWVRDGNGNVTRIIQYADTVTFSEIGSAAASNAALDHVTVIEYDSYNRETYRTDPMGSVTRSEYDLSGNLVKRTRFYNQVAVGSTGSAVIGSSSDRVERFVYDAANRQTWASDATGAVTQFAYDKLGNLTQTTRYATLAPGVSPDTVAADATNDRITSYSYDKANRRTYEVDALGYVTQYVYDDAGYLVTVRRYLDLPDSRSTPATAVANDTNDRVQRFEYDNAGRQTKSTDALGNSESYTYDGAGNKLTFTNKNGDTWTYTYDALGRLRTEKGPAVRLWTMTRNSNDGTLTLGGGTADVAIITTLAYDNFGNLVSRTEADGRVEERTTSYEYDKLGRQIKVTYPSVAVHGELTSEVAGNLRLDQAARDETDKPVYTQTWYDSFGNAVSSTDRNGYSSFKTYDAAGRVRYEVDALGYVIRYSRNAFGEATSLCRYASATTLASTAPTSSDPGPTTADVDAVVNAAGFADSLDRTLSTSYDKMGRVTMVNQQDVHNYNSTNGNIRTDYGPRTYTAYNAFGDVMRVAEMSDVDATGGIYAYSYHYYDRAGHKTATVDAGRYLTTFAYDSEGNLKTQVEYANQLSTTSVSDAYTAQRAPAAPTASATDRTTTWSYDKLNRKTGETQVKVDTAGYSSSATSTTLTLSADVDLATTFGYDAVGNQIWVKDAAGAITRTYYDALGRTRAIVAPSRASTVDGEALLPVVEFRRDAYGNVLMKLDRANTATDVTTTSYTVTGSSLDRNTLTLYDTSGNARQVNDALGNQHYNAYTADGKLAKSWQTVTDNDLKASTIYTAYYYDKLGRLQNSYAPSAMGTNAVSTNYRYNAFGEVAARGKASGWQEYFEYDNAGRLWKTNVDDGNAKVFLYDLLGRQTAEITSTGSGRKGGDVATATSAAQAESWTTRRVEIKYDALGHVIERREAERMITEGGITTRLATANASITSSAQSSWQYNDYWDEYYSDHVTNTVSLSWTDLGYLGSGDVKVDLTYKSGYVAGHSSSVTRSESQIFAGFESDKGVSLSWKSTVADENEGWAGISAISRVIVSKRDVNGEWVKIIDREPGAGRAFGNYGTQVEIGSPIDPSTSVTFKYRKDGTTDWVTAALKKFGDSHWFDATALSGKYFYQVYFTQKDRPAELTESGDFTTKTNDEGDSSKTENWKRPTIAYVRDRWGNALKQSDPRNTTWMTEFTYNRNNQVVTEKRPDPSNGDLTANSPTRTIYYDRLGRQVAIMDGLGHVNGQYYDAAGNLGKEVHADGGVITHFYDAFGQKVQSVDALGNSAIVNGVLDTASALYRTQTTRFAYDKLGRLLTTTHGNTYFGLVSVYGVNSNSLALESKGKKDLQEKFGYDEAGRKLWQTNGAGETTKYWYDRAGNVIKTQLPGGEYSTATFDGYGHKLTETDANGVNTVTWTYDTDFGYFGRLSSHKDLGGATYTYEYDSAGQLTKQTNTRGQNLAYAYDAAGQLVRIGDASQSLVTTTAYDLAGHHVREKAMRSSTGEVFQDNHLTYDTLGRLIDSADNRAHITFAYDKADNRTRVTTRTRVALVGDPDSETIEDTDRYFKYDEMNRQIVVDGVDADGNIGSSQGHKITYDLNGNRLSDKYWGNVVKTTTPYYYVFNPDTYTTEYVQGSPVYTKTLGYTVETYSYDALDRLMTVDRDGTLVDVRRYDGASRVVQSGPSNLPTAYASKLNEDVPADQQIGMEVRRQLYDANGRMLVQRAFKSDGTSLKYDVDYRDEVVSNITFKGYDDAGNVLRYKFKNYDGTDYTNTSTVTLAKFENYVEARTVTSSTMFSTGTSTSTYDDNGYLIKVDDATENTLDKTIVNDAAGRVLRVDQSGNRLYTHIVNGEMLGKFGVGPNEIDPRTSKNKANFQQVADFDLGYRSITGSYPAPSVGAYTVRQGDSLQSIARAALGDADQWWRIAQANGLSGDRDLRVGQTLTLPSTAAGATNDATTFKPYNPSDVIGDTSPNLPQPKQDKGCGALGQIIMIVVAIVVTAIVAPQLVPTMGNFLSGAVASAAGSVASQAVGIAIGAQDGFSWKQVAAAAIAGGVSGGLQGIAGGDASLAGTGLKNTIVRAAVSNAMTQGIGIAVGLQESFSWSGVAAAAVGAGLGEAVNDELLGARSEYGVRNLDTNFARQFGNATTAKVASGVLAGMVSGASVAALRGGRVSIQQIAADAFGNALGDSIVAEMSRRDLPPVLQEMSDGQRERVFNLASRIGADLSDPDTLKAVLEAAETQSGVDLSRSELERRTQNYLRAGGATDDVILKVTSQYAENGVYVKRAVVEVRYPSDLDVASTDSSGESNSQELGADSLDRQAGLADSRKPAFGSYQVDRAVVGTGLLVNKFAEFVDQDPVAKYTLIGLDVAAGPVAFAVREAVMQTPVGELVTKAEGAVADFVAGRLGDAGHTYQHAEAGGVGGLALLSLGAQGFSGAIKGITNAVGNMAARGNLRRTLGLTDNAYQAHHLIPYAIGRDSAAIQHAIKYLGYDINRKENGIGLPRDATLADEVLLPQHSGPHPEYSASARRLTERLDVDYLSLSPQQVMSRIEAIEDLLRAQVLASRGKLK